MTRLGALVAQQPITIETPLVRRQEGERADFPTSFTLSYQGQFLQDRIHAEQTITVEEAITTLFMFIDMGQSDSAFRKLGKQTERRLRRLLGAMYEAFWQAYLADEKERMQGQFIEVKPDPEHVDERTDGTQLKRLMCHDLSFGMRVVYFDSISFPNVYVGRVEEVRRTSFGEMAESGLIVEVILLEADDYGHLEDLFFKTYIRSSEPPAPGVYAWPGNLPQQTFQKPKRPGHLVSFQMKLPCPIKIIIASSADFDGSED